MSRHNWTRCSIILTFLKVLKIGKERSQISYLSFICFVTRWPNMSSQWSFTHWNGIQDEISEPVSQPGTTNGYIGSASVPIPVFPFMTYNVTIQFNKEHLEPCYILFKRCRDTHIFKKVPLSERHILYYLSYTRSLLLIYSIMLHYTIIYLWSLLDALCFMTVCCVAMLDWLLYVPWRRPLEQPGNYGRWCWPGRCRI